MITFIAGVPAAGFGGSGISTNITPNELSCLGLAAASIHGKRSTLTKKIHNLWTGIFMALTQPAWGRLLPAIVRL
jgi:hypothetical protein